MPDYIDIFCWDCNDFTLGVVSGVWGGKRFIRCQECNNYDTDESSEANAELMALLRNDNTKHFTGNQEKEIVMSSADNELLKRECTTKSCRRKNLVIATSGKVCTGCGQRLAICKDQNRAVDMVDPYNTYSKGGDQSPLPIITQGTPPADDPLVLVDHVTHWKADESDPQGHRGSWDCWCGFSTIHTGNGTDSASGHDRNAPAEMPRSKVPQGVTYRLKTMPTLSYTQNTTPTPGKSDNWETVATCPDINGCPLINESKWPHVYIPAEMWKKWMCWARKFNTEWLAYLIGEALPKSETDPNGGWTITALHVPKQKVTGAHVTVDEASIRDLPAGIIGDVHSHVRMNAYFSTEDERHFNHPLHIVVNAREEFATSVRVPLECGKTTRTKAKVFTVGAEEETAWEAEMRSQLQDEPPAGNAASTASGGDSSTSSGYSHSGYSAYGNAPSRDESIQPARTITGTGWRGAQDTWKV